ncbi:efflux RND transporter periplasmic adaptor subunit [Tautonia sociabilis]|uniref:HlyD family efflux transporter periplasmic adaptor subunit n=1 Tax=Tautonia sociabilis TaxID=2080755 RepID=A0A432MH06_9BACT|nr:efflux RND transporter periplasmic adaptor subunit [Tautonia sociabilis]RUL85938.1 HlyD family efflux transporter periplasmic adaptor subunit [Tautonia sociabilis]
MSEVRGLAMAIRSRRRWMGAVLAVVAPAVVVAWAPRGKEEADAVGQWIGRSWGEVRVEEVGPTLDVPGTACSASETAIEPKVELLADVPPVMGIFGMAAPTRIIELVPEGTRVAKGEVICLLDPSAYADAARRLRIEVEAARSSRAEAERALAVAEANLVAFRDGDRVQQERRLEAERAIAQVDLTRAEGHLSWSSRMGALGYVSMADLAEDRVARLRAQVAWNQAEVALDTYRRATIERTLRDLEATVERARTQLAFALEELKGTEDRLKHLERQVEHCTIRAPHDGTVFFADVSYGEYYRVREGAEVYPGLPLFLFPDLERMEVELFVHERFARRVSEGQEAAVSFEAFPGRSFLGHVSEVELIPTPDWRHFGEWQHFRVRVALDEKPDGLLPDMSARVELRPGPRTEALTVPAEAVLWDESGPFCVVNTPSGPARRDIRVDRGTVDRLVVLDGLEPGDSVLLNPEARPRDG